MAFYYHTNDEGKTMRCDSPDNCPFGASLDRKESIQNYENRMAAKTLPAAAKRKTRVQRSTDAPVVTAPSAKPVNASTGPAVASTAGPGVNVSAAETVFINDFLALVDGDKGAFTDYDAIDDKNKPAFLRGKNATELAAISEHLLDSVSASTGVDRDKLAFTASRNNREGSDLLETNSGISVELKLGAATDINVGFGPVAEHLIPGNKNDLFPTGTDRERWRESFRAGDVDSIKAEQKAMLSATAEKLTASHAGRPLDENATKLVEAYYQGITNEKEALSSDVTSPRTIHRFDLNSDGTWVTKVKTASKTGEWAYDSFNYNPSSNRFTFTIRSSDGKSKLGMVLNYKNRYKYPDGVKADAKLGLGSPSFNGWWKETTATGEAQ